MSRMSELLQARLPEGVTVPAALEAAWTWMEAQGWGEEDSAGYTAQPLGTAGRPTQRAAGAYALRPHGGDPAYGVLFTPEAEIPEPFFSSITHYEPGKPGYDRLLPIGVTGDPGDVAALWLDDDGAIRFVELRALSPRLIADTAEGFLRAVAIGDEPFRRGEHLDDEAALTRVAREDLAPFRAWVEESFGEPVPAEWQEPAQEALEVWDRRMKQEHAELAREQANRERADELAAFTAGLPDPAELERRFRILGIVEATLADHDFKYAYARSFPGRPERFGRYDNGAGDTIFAFFGDDGAFVRAFDHEDGLDLSLTGGRRTGVLDGLPERFRPLAEAPELEDEDWDAEEEAPSITLALWSTGEGWRHGSAEPDEHGVVPEPTTWMFHLLAGGFTAEEIAEDFGAYFGTSIDAAALEPFLELRPLTRERVLAVNPDPNWRMLERVAEHGGYPSEL